MFLVRASKEVCFLRHGGGGTHLLQIKQGGQDVLVTFSRHPVEFEELPPEVAADPLLVVEEVPGPKTPASTSAKTKKGRR